MIRFPVIAGASLAASLLAGSAQSAPAKIPADCAVTRILADGREIKTAAAKNQSTARARTGQASSASAHSSSSSGSRSSMSVSSSSSARSGGTARATSSTTDASGRTVTMTRDERGCRVVIDES